MRKVWAIGLLLVIILGFIAPLMPTAQSSLPPENEITAVVDKVISTNLWLTTGAAAGAGDGSSFANRDDIATWEPNLGSLTVNADVNLTVVLETASGAIVLGDNQVAAKTFTCYGGFYTVDSNNLPIHPGNTCAFRLAIGGTTSYRCGRFIIVGTVLQGNVDWGQDTAGDGTCNAVAANIFTVDGYSYNCTNKMYANQVVYLNSGVWEVCTFYGQNDGSGYCVNVGFIPGPTFIDCIQITTGTYWLSIPSTYSYTSTIRIIGDITKGGAGGGSIYHAAQTTLIAHYYRRAFVKATTDGTTALASAYYQATEATGGVDMPLASGITGADGLCTPESPTPYNNAIWCLQKVETYIRTTAGAMTWGTPTYTTNYGQYTFTFSKSGYDTATYTRAMTTDWGTLATPIAITMNATTPHLPPGLWDINPFYSYEDGTYAVHKVNYTHGADMFAQGRFTWNANIDDVLCNATLYSSPTATPLAWWNASYDFLANTTTSTDTIFGIGLSYDTGNAGNGSFYLAIQFENSTITTTTIAVQYAVLPALIPGLQDDAWVGTYDSLLNFAVAFVWGDLCVPEGNIVFTYDTTAMLNVTIRDSGGWDVLWLANATETYTAGVAIQLTTTTGAISFDTALLVNGSYIVAVMLSDENITTTYIYGSFVIVPEIPIPILTAITTNATGFAITAIGMSCSIYYNATLNLSASIEDVQINVSVYTALGAWVETLYADATQDFAENIMRNTTELNGAVISFGATGHAPGSYEIRLTIGKWPEMANWTIVSQFEIMHTALQAWTTDISGNLIASFSDTAILFYNASLNLSRSITNLAINISVYTALGAWVETMYASATDDFIGNVARNTTELNGAVLTFMTTGHAPGNYYIAFYFGKAGEIDGTNYTNQFSIIATPVTPGTGSGSYDPFADFTFHIEGHNVVFNYTGTYALRCLWSFGDGMGVNETNPAHRYSKLDNYSVTLEAIDLLGQSHRVTKWVDLTEPKIIEVDVTFGIGFTRWVGVWMTAIAFALGLLYSQSIYVITDKKGGRTLIPTMFTIGLLLITGTIQWIIDLAGIGSGVFP